jgi:hypothetical protein
MSTSLETQAISGGQVYVAVAEVMNKFKASLQGGFLGTLTIV